MPSRPGSRPWTGLAQTVGGAQRQRPATQFRNAGACSGSRRSRRPTHQVTRLKLDLGMFAQDQWTIQQSDAQPGRAVRPPQRVQSRHRPARPASSRRRSTSPRSTTCRTGRTSRRGWAPPTTCLATARPRSRCRWAGMCLRDELRSPARPIRARRSPPATTGRGTTRTATTSPTAICTVKARQRRVRRDGRISASARRIAATQYAQDVTRRLGRAPVQLAGLGVAPARAAAGRRADRRLLPHVVRQLPRHRQSGGDAGGFRSVLHHGAGGCAAARRRRVSDLRALRRAAGEVRPGRQPRDAQRRISGSGRQVYNGVDVSLSARFGRGGVCCPAA